MKKVFLILFTLQTFLLASQPKPKVTQGHNFQIGAVDLSEDGRFVLSAAGDKKLILWDTQFGFEVQQFKGLQTNSMAAAISDHGSYVACLAGGGVSVWETENPNKIRTYQDKKMNWHAKEMCFVDDSLLLFAIDSKIVLWDVKNNIKLRETDSLGHCFSLVIEKKRQLFASYDGSKVHVFSLNSFQKTHSFPSDIKEVINIAIHPKKNQLLLSGNTSAALEYNFNGETLQRYAIKETAYTPSVFYLPQGEVVALSNKYVQTWSDKQSLFYEIPFQITVSSSHIKNGKIALGSWDFNTGILDVNKQQFEDFTPGMVACEGLIKTSKGFAFKGRDGVIRNFDFSKLTNPDFFDDQREDSGNEVQTMGSIQRFAFGPKAAYSAHENKLFEINDKTKLIENQWEVEGTIYQLQSNLSGLYCLTGDYGSCRIYYLDFKTGEWTLWWESKMDVEHLALSKNGIYFSKKGSWTDDGKIYLMNYQKKMLDSLSVGKVNISMLKWDATKDQLTYSTGGFHQKTTLLSMDLNVINEWDGRNHAQQNGIIALYKNKIGEEFASICIFNESGKELALIKEAHQGIISYMEFSEDGKCLITSAWDKSTKIWDWKNEKLLATLFFPERSEDVHIFSDESYYFSTKNAVNDIYFLEGLNPILFQQYDAHLNRPEKVLENFKESDRELINFHYKTHQKRLERLGTQEIKAEDLGLIPTIGDVVFSHEVEMKNGFKIKSQKNYQLLLNGVKQKKLKSTNGWDYYNAVLGENLIEIYHQNNMGIKSTSRFFKFNSIIEQDASDLYLVCLGVSNFKNADFNLKFPEKDAQDIESYFKKSWSQGNVKSMVLSNEKCIKKNLQQISSLLKQAKTNDKVMLFVSSHGVFDENLNYFIAGYDMDFQNPSKNGIKLDDLEYILALCPAVDKVMFIDACHSGEVDKSEIQESERVIENSNGLTFRAVKSYQNTTHQSAFQASKEIFKDLASENGISIISSAAGVEFAIEGEEWKNGVFTYVLLDALKSLQADLNHDGKIMLEELENYLFYQVPKITNGLQQPNARLQNHLVNFKIN